MASPCDFIRAGGRRTVARRAASRSRQAAALAQRKGHMKAMIRGHRMEQGPPRSVLVRSGG